MKSQLIKLLTVSVLFAGLSACKQKTIEVNQNFSRYISGFTSGQISTKAVIQIELAEDQPQVEPFTEIKDKVFSFSPAVKGRVYWKSKRLIEFSPDEPLKEGTLYRVNFHLNKVLSGLDKEFRTFSFDVRTIEQNFAIEDAFYQPIRDNQNRWNAMSVEVSVADAVTNNEAAEIFSAELG
ncbi:MAG: hypothetical protein FWG79_02345, partial [Bacteroidales bacterium]|nr:hypothetical protein [Bacteroidales bacterium]